MSGSEWPEDQTGEEQDLHDALRGEIPVKVGRLQ